MPDISLGDMEAVMDLGNELNLFKENNIKSVTRTKPVDTERIIQAFSIQHKQQVVEDEEDDLFRDFDEPDESKKLKENSPIQSIKDNINTLNKTEFEVDDESDEAALEAAALAAMLASDEKDLDEQSDESFDEDDIHFNDLELFGESDDSDRLGDIDELDDIDGLDGFDDEDEDTEVKKEEPKQLTQSKPSEFDLDISGLQKPSIQTDLKSDNNIDELDFDDMGDLGDLGDFEDDESDLGDLAADNLDDELSEFDDILSKADKQIKSSDTMQAKASNKQITEAALIDEGLSDEEIELQQRIENARRIKQQEEAKAERLRKLKEEALAAEAEAERARKLREEIQKSKLSTSEQHKEKQDNALRSEEERKKKLKSNMARLALLNSSKESKPKAEARPRVETSKPKVETHTQSGASKYDRYNSLDIDALYNEVKLFLKKHNIEKKLIDKKLLESEFGEQNIRKLILKSYLISMKKGVTVGR